MRFLLYIIFLLYAKNPDTLFIGYIKKKTGYLILKIRFPALINNYLVTSLCGLQTICKFFHYL